MMEKIVLSRRLVIGHKRDGRCCYDLEAKRELVEACRRPGVLVGRAALDHGINASLLRKWIAKAPSHLAGIDLSALRPHPEQTYAKVG